MTSIVSGVSSPGEYQEWIPWHELQKLHEALPEEVWDYEAEKAINFDFPHADPENAPVPGVDWYMGKKKCAVRVKVEGLSATQIAAFCFFAHSIPYDWSGDPTIHEYEIEGKKFLEIEIDPD